MKGLKRAMSTLGILLVIVGFSTDLSTLLQYIGSFLGMTKEQVCILIGCIDLLALAVVNCIDHAIKERRKINQIEESISDFERKLFGKVVSINDYKEGAPKVIAVHPDIIAAQEEVAASFDDKELRYQRALAKMEERRKKAPKSKKRKKFSVSKKSAPSFKERVGGIRRAS